MAVTDNKRVVDGWISLEMGVDQGKSPNLIGKNASAFAVNTTFRGGWPYPRPGWRKCNLDFSDNDNPEDVSDAFKLSLFQCGSGYTADSGSGSAISMQSGRVFKVDLKNFRVSEISIAGDYNNPSIAKAWTLQAEKYFIIQDGQSKPFIYNGGSSRRATEREIPVAKMMAYYMGRIWLAFGREYLAGDIIYGPSGTETEGYRDSILKVTENTYLAEGGTFSVPVSAGDITALRPIANINTALGQGELITYTDSAVFATQVPQLRSVWKDTREPLQRMIQLANGALSQDAIVNVNEDLFYRSNDGIRSLAYAVRNAGQWGNTPVSNEVQDLLAGDARDFLKYGSGVNFDNRMLMTCSPGVSHGHGVYHRGLAVLDFDLITGMQAKQPPAWEGVWTGHRYLKIFTVVHQGVERCFAYVLNAADEIELWELTRGDKADWDGENDVRIRWTIDSRSMDFGSKFDSVNLFAGDMFFDRVSGQVDFAIKYRPDSYPCWIDWDSWDECAKVSMCAEDFTGVCVTLENLQEQYRPWRQLKQPADTFDPITKHLMRVGYEIQFRLEIEGFCRVKQFRAAGYQTQQRPYGEQL